MKVALAGANSSLIQCDIYTLAEASYERPDVFGAFVTIQDGFHGEENELWSYVNLVDRSDWDTAETFRQPLRLVQTMRKASRLFKAEGVAQPASWDQALEQIVMNFPAAWDEDFAYCSEGHFVDGQDQTNYLLMMCRAAAAVEEPPKGVGLAGSTPFNARPAPPAAVAQTVAQMVPVDGDSAVLVAFVLLTRAVAAVPGRGTQHPLPAPPQQLTHWLA